MYVQLQRRPVAYVFTSRPWTPHIGGSSRLAFLLLRVVSPHALSTHTFSRIDALYVTTQSRGI
jgi:hypothetical protein